MAHASTLQHTSDSRYASPRRKNAQFRENERTRVIKNEKASCKTCRPSSMRGSWRPPLPQISRPRTEHKTGVDEGNTGGLNFCGRTSTFGNRIVRKPRREKEQGKGNKEKKREVVNEIPGSYPRLYQPVTHKFLPVFDSWSRTTATRSLPASGIRILYPSGHVDEVPRSGHLLYLTREIDWLAIRSFHCSRHSWAHSRCSGTYSKGGEEKGSGVGDTGGGS
ncbi:hypothetical protein B0T10DRAFT_30779 [Thelonectria olida]|uniref:Uncharacterized protein n=1 Tax=Thelonectria olida TaxID=1576542 RepID=A0A9P8WIZ3_9HYPO|nr:hypothetical protein B0T10DRAFT_30779 [Thelonectria olida]